MKRYKNNIGERGRNIVKTEREQNLIYAGAICELNNLKAMLKLTPEEEAIVKQKKKTAKRKHNEETREKLRQAQRKRPQEEKMRKEVTINKKDSGGFIEEPLTPKEEEIIGLLIDGFSYKECSKILCITMATTKTHINNIFEKKGYSTLQQLIIGEIKGKKSEEIEALKKEKIQKREFEQKIINSMNILKKLKF